MVPLIIRIGRIPGFIEPSIQVIRIGSTSTRAAVLNFGRFEAPHVFPVMERLRKEAPAELGEAQLPIDQLTDLHVQHVKQSVHVLGV